MDGWMDGCDGLPVLTSMLGCATYWILGPVLTRLLADAVTVAPRIPPIPTQTPGLPA